MTLKLRRITIKPTLICTANCPTCNLRSEFFETRKQDYNLTFNQWVEILEDAQKIGCQELHISGGEPSLYPDLDRLVEVGSNLGMAININTNGSHLTISLAERLLKAGLNSITFSIYSCIAQVHNEMRKEDYLFEKAIKAIEYLAPQPMLTVNIQTILARRNLLDLANLLEMAYELKATRLIFSYIEGNTGNEWLPTVEQIKEFRRTVLPNMLEIVERNSSTTKKQYVKNKIKTMFSKDEKRILQLSHGLYFPNITPNCSRPYDYAMVLANGEILPCNGAEYSHSVIMGNVQIEKLSLLWNKKGWNNFRKRRHKWCHQCPMSLHFDIPIS